MPCLLAILALAFPRVAIILLWLFTSFFNVLHSNIIVPILGFLFLPLTLIVYTYILKTYGGHLGVTQIVILFIAAIIDLGLVRGGAWRRG
jgi:hypothetical protein